MPRHDMRNNYKPKNMKKTFARMIKDFNGLIPLIVVIVVLSVLGALLNVLSPVVLKDILSQENMMKMFKVVGDTIHIEWLIFYQKFGIIIGIYVLASILQWLSEFLSASISAKYAYGLRDRVDKKLDKLPLSYFDKTAYGDTLSIGTNDVDNISRNLQTIITQTFTGVALFVGSLVAMFVTNWQIALVAIASLPLTLIIVFLISKFSGKQFKNYRTELGVLNGKVEEDYAGYKVIKLFNKEEDIEKEFDISNEKMRRADGLSQFFSGLIFPTTFFIQNLTYVGIAVVGGLISDAATMITFFLFLRLFNSPFQQLGQIASVIQSVMASGERIYNLLDETEEVKDVDSAITNEELIKGNFKFDNVYFQYNSQKPLIENWSLDVKAGDTIAIVGQIATLLNLDPVSKENLPYDDKLSIRENTELAKNNIRKYYLSALEKIDKKLLDDVSTSALLNFLVNTIPNHLNNGNIYLEDKPIKDYTRNCLRGAVGMVLQDTWLFKGTIKENLLYGDQNATDEELKKACDEAHISHFIETLPGGFDYMLNEDGNNVSQGQRQLLTIARAIVSKPKILILDEATSSVDTRTEQQIQDALVNIMKNRTSFVIAHRLSTIKNAKMIIVMKKGHIVEVGNHKELLAKNGFYAELYNSQFAGSNPMEKQSEKEDI